MKNLHKHQTRVHASILLVFAILFAIPFLPTDLTGLTVSNITDVNISESNTTNTTVEAISNLTQNITTNVTIEEIITTTVNIDDATCTYDGTNFTICETITWSNGSYAKGYISGTKSVSQVEKQVNSTFTYCEISDKEGTKALHAYVYDDEDKILIKNIGGKVTCSSSNVTQVNQTNVTPNVTIPITITPTPNISGNITTNIGTEVITQYQAIIGQPVKWKKTIKLDQKTSNVEIELPKGAKVTAVKKIENNQAIDITAEETQPGSPNLLTGAAVIETTDNTSLVIEQEIEEVEIEYETEAPQVFEEYVGQTKRITITSEIHYENILTFTSIPDVRESSISLYRMVNGSRVPHPIINYTDSDDSGLIDQIYWITPYLSNHTFEVDITVLNVQSFPPLNGNWTVNFTTNGTANLTITPINGTTYGNASPNDLKFLELNCNGSVLSPVFNGSSVFYQNYNCTGISQHIAKVGTPGNHTLQFNFGNDTAYAYNTAGTCGGATVCECGEELTSPRTLTSSDPVTQAPCPGNGINIVGGGVTLDCDGFTIQGLSTPGQIGINVSGGSDDVAIDNCDVLDYDIGLQIEDGSARTLVTDLNITNSVSHGINLSSTADDTTLTRMKVQGSGGSGILAENADNLQILQSNFSNNSVHGIHLSNLTGAFLMGIFANESRNQHGIVLDFVNASNLTDIAARNNQLSGLVVRNSSQGNTIDLGAYDNNSVSSLAGAGVEFDEGSYNNTFLTSSFKNNYIGLWIGRTQITENNSFGGNNFNGQNYAEIVINNSLL